jgi:hypothetical protein
VVVVVVVLAVVVVVVAVVVVTGVVTVVVVVVVHRSYAAWMFSNSQGCISTTTFIPAMSGFLRCSSDGLSHPVIHSVTLVSHINTADQTEKFEYAQTYNNNNNNGRQAHKR